VELLEFPPDAVFVALGINDFSSRHAREEGFEAAFTKAYVALLRELALVYSTSKPELNFFLVVGPMTSRYKHAVEAAAASTAQHGIDSSRLHVLTWLDNRTGCQKHPNHAANEAMFALAVGLMSRALGWGSAAEAAAEIEVVRTQHSMFMLALMLGLALLLLTPCCFKRCSDRSKSQSRGAEYHPVGESDQDELAELQPLHGQESALSDEGEADEGEADEVIIGLKSPRVGFVGDKT
jgi:hypothetical protein